MQFAKPRKPDRAHATVADTGKAGSGRPAVPVCPECKEEMVVTLALPLTSVPGFEDVFYECPRCHLEVKRTAIPM